MKVLVDTSCWIAAVRDPEGFEFSVIRSLVRENVVVTSSLIIAELLRGSKGNKEIRFMDEEFLEIPVVTGLDLLGVKIGYLGFRLKKRGYTIATIDLALSVLSIENHLLLYSLDRHFEMIAKQSPLKLFKPLKH
jgi:hypothetical protein